MKTLVTISARPPAQTGCSMVTKPDGHEGKRYDRLIVSRAPDHVETVLSHTSVEHTRLGDRMQFLDALRGLAVMCVVVQHSVEQLYPAWVTFSLGRFRLGEFGVVLFFLCSGFIIPASLERQGSQARFWIGRLFRLFPLYWAAVAGVLILHYGFDRYPLPADFIEHPIRFTAINLTMLQDFLGAPLALGQSWSLAYELVFYGLVSAMFVAVLHRKSIVWSSGAFLLAMVVNTRHVPTQALNQGGNRTLVIVAVSLLIAVPYVFYVTRGMGPQRWLALAITIASILLVLNRPETLSTAMLFLGTLFFGTCLFRWSEGVVSGRALARLVVLAFVTIVVVWTTGDIYWGIPGGVSTKAFKAAEILTFGAAYVVFLVALRFRSVRFPRPLLYLGTISYSLYLLHAFPIYAVGRVFDNRPLDALFWIGLAVVISSVTYTLIEKPSIKLGRTLSARAGQRWARS